VTRDNNNNKSIPEVSYQQQIFAIMFYLYQDQNFYVHYLLHLAKRYFDSHPTWPISWLHNLTKGRLVQSCSVSVCVSACMRMHMSSHFHFRSLWLIFTTYSADIMSTAAIINTNFLFSYPASHRWSGNDTNDTNTTYIRHLKQHTLKDLQ
jgi:hypothetical protein